MFWILKLCLCNVPGLGGSDFKDNHFRFTEKRSVSTLKTTWVTFSQAGVQEENLGKPFGRYVIYVTVKRAQWNI